MQTNMEGSVKFFNPVKEYGFITLLDKSGLSKDIFFHKSALPLQLSSSPCRGDKIYFNYFTNKVGKLVAPKVWFKPQTTVINTSNSRGSDLNKSLCHWHNEFGIYSISPPSLIL